MTTLIDRLRLRAGYNPKRPDAVRLFGNPDAQLEAAAADALEAAGRSLADVEAEYKATLESNAQLKAENTLLRGLLPRLGAPCVYCGLTEIAKCAHGFPGCGQADDLMCGDAFKRLIAERDKWKRQESEIDAAQTDAKAALARYDAERKQP